MTPLYWLVVVAVSLWIFERVLHYFWTGEDWAQLKRSHDSIRNQLSVLIFHVRQSNQRLESNEFYRSKERP